MKKRGSLICFIGIDGSGKTTLAKKVNEDLRQDKLDCKYVYGRVVPVLSRFFMWMGRRFLLRKKEEDIFHDYSNYVHQKRKIFKNGFISKIYGWSILFDQIIQTNLKIRPRLLAGKIVICDRYIFDTVITDIAVDLDYSESDAINLINKLFRILPKPDVIFLIDLPEEVAYNRKNDVPHVSYLRERRELYLRVSELYNIILLNGVKSPQELREGAYKVSLAEVTKNE